MHSPKILVLDIETAPAMGYFWSILNTNIGISQIVNASKLICFAAKWIGDKKIHFYSNHKDTHKKMVKEAWNLITLRAKSLGVDDLNRFQKAVY